MTRSFLRELSANAKAEMAQSEFIPDGMWELLKTDTSDVVRAACCYNTRVTDAEKEEFLSDISDKVISSLCREQRLSEAQCWRVISEHKGNWVAHYELGAHQRLNSEQIKTLLYMYASYDGECKVAVSHVLGGLFKNKAAGTDDFVWALANIEPRKDVLGVVLKCDNTPGEVLESLYCENRECADHSVLAKIVCHKNATEGVLIDAYARGEFENELYSNPSTPRNIRDVLEASVSKKVNSIFSKG